MKKTIALIIALSLGCMLALAEPLSGGWEIVPNEPAALPEEAQAAFDKALNGLIGAEYTPVALVGTPLVAGMNYCILCQVTPVVPDPAPGSALVYIYADLDGNAEITNVAELDIPGLWNPAEEAQD